MKKIRELYNDINDDTLVKDIKINSKEVEEGDIFVCTMGVTADRHDFASEAINNGAKLIVASRKIDSTVPVKYVNDTNKELINLARKVYDFDDSKLDLIGITGTNGKTTTALMIKQLLGDSCGYMGTNGIISKNFKETIRNTTPDADRLYKYFKRFTDDGCSHLAIETSSEAFFRKRMDSLNFKIGVITSITRDHLNIHKTIENYVDCKMDLLRKVRKDGYCILNVDDNYYDLALSCSNGNILTYGRKESTLQIIDVPERIDGTKVILKYENNNYEFESPYLGEINVYNLCAAILVCLAYGQEIEDIIKKVPNLKGVEGRFHFLDYGQNYKIMLDYAHTLDAFKKILPFLNKVKKAKLIVLTGAAGGRDKDKRPGIGSYLLENSDEVIFTMDDPRNEKVSDIIKDMISESKKDNYIIIEDRKEAIKYALDNAKENDIVLVAGKGIDNYMAVKDQYLEYSDLAEIDKYFNKK